MPELTPLASIVLGFVRLLPSTGFGLRRIFRSTPLGNFSDSPGSIYPLLARLERAGLVKGTIDRAPGARRRKVFSITDAGTDALRAWLMSPIDPEFTRRHPDLYGIRFAFMSDGLLSAREQDDVLAGFERGIRDEIARLTAVLQRLPPTTPRGIRSLITQAVDMFQGRLAWLAGERRRVRRKPGGKR
jgi:DNA-binding PadR family transcriptional regulator